MNYGGGKEFTHVWQTWYGNLGTSSTEMYGAQLADIVVSKRIRVKVDRRLKATDGIRVDDVVYRIVRIYNDPEGRYLDISLEEV